MTDNKIKILCVEDEIDIRSNISDILRDEGYDVIEAGNGYEGYEAFVRQRPDLIISDIMMPELDGYGLLKLVRETSGLKQSAVPFLFLTALGQKDSVIKGVNLSANDYLIKPIDFDLLIAKVKEKTTNQIRVENIHQGQINNLKNQISVALPKDVFLYLDNITTIASNLKDEPFGPFPHRAYLDEIKKIYLNCLNLRTAINNNLDHDAIDFKLNAQEEIISLGIFFEEFLSNIDPRLASKIELTSIKNINLLPNIKIDRIILTEAVGLTIYEMLKVDTKSKILISAMTDHLKQIVIIFYLEGSDENDIKNSFKSSKISKTLDKQNCRFEILDNKKNTAIITIPEYRLV
ncbi:MAG: response regulator [Proteobacteria bacterium]|nr:response regulator [Pseudomonadota bacterium]NCA28293.1 response regulator [Pseudomonadota bacterium]